MTEQQNLFAKEVTADNPSFLLTATDRERRVAIYLSRNAIGEKRAIPADELATISALSRRVLRMTIHSLVVQYGYPIATKYKGRKDAGNHGYFIPASEKEAEDCYRSLVSHALNILHRASRLKKSSPLKEICGQLNTIAEGR